MSQLTVVKVATLRQNLADVLRTLEKGKNFLIVTHRGQPVSALVNLDLFEDLLAKASPSYLKEIRTARREYSQGKFSTHTEIFGGV